MEEIKDGWYYCPRGHKTAQRIEKNSDMENTPVWCKHCKRAYYPRVTKGKLHEISENRISSMQQL